MRLCQKCWKNLKDNPAVTLHNKKNNNCYLICNECNKTDLVQSMINSGNWECILNTPTLKEMLQGATK